MKVIHSLVRNIHQKRFDAFVRADKKVLAGKHFLKCEAIVTRIADDIIHSNHERSLEAKTTVMPR